MPGMWCDRRRVLMGRQGRGRGEYRGSRLRPDELQALGADLVNPVFGFAGFSAFDHAVLDQFGKGFLALDWGISNAAGKFGAGQWDECAAGAVPEHAAKCGGMDVHFVPRVKLDG